MLNDTSNSGDLSRKTRRSSSTSSPNGVRKSQRLEKRPSSAPSTPNNKPGVVSPVRRSVRHNKGLRTPDSSKGKTQDIADEVRVPGMQNSSPEVGSKRKQRLDARRSLKKIQLSESEPDKKNEQEICDVSGDSDPEEIEERIQEQSDGEELKHDRAMSIDGDVAGSNSGVKETVGVGNSRDNRTVSCLPENEAEGMIDNIQDVQGNGSMMEELPNQEIKLDSNNQSDDVGSSRHVPKEITSAVGSKGTDTCAVYGEPMVTSSCKMSISADECAKCLRTRSLGHNAPEQELCCCLPSNVNNVEDSKVLCCERVLQKFPPTCLWNRKDNIQLQNWFFSECTKKRLALGVHSLSEVIESILDVREVELSNSEGRQKQKQYFVKYKGLAHIHNCWVSETVLLHDAPELLVKFGKRKEDMGWNLEWTVPHRLLKRRSVVGDRHDESVDEVGLELDSQHEWLVKWRGLDYDQATWELEDSSWFKKPEIKHLIEEWETRHNRSRGTLLSGSNEIQEQRKGSHVKPGKHSVGGVDSCYLNSVIQLHDFHQKDHNAVLLDVDEQDRFVEVIYFVSLLLTNVCRPFLIISSKASLSSWEAEFLRLAASINVVVYDGNIDARRIIRNFEFYDKGGSWMLQVLISSAESISEDFEELKGIEWEAVILDYCQQSCILAHSACIKNLATHWRLMLVAQMKETAAEYINILSLLGSNSNEIRGLVDNSSEGINLLKERFSSYVICARFIEYWVPVEISNLQLEQYCYSILSNSSALCSFSKSDRMGSLRDILISIRKCCDHPYTLDAHLQASLTRGLSQGALLDLGIRASGKLHLLEKLLLELRKQELKVLILFQSIGGSGRDSTGDILEDFLHFRFGRDSYEHVAFGLAVSKRQAACNMFNSVKERSFFMLETRACSPTIKLLSVDTVIIFESDWNPLSDIRALQRITVDSKQQPIKVFRLYCSCTVEEKVLAFCKNSVVLDSNLQYSPSTKHMLIMWGSSYLFRRLDEFHQESIIHHKENIAFESSFLMDVCQEVVSLIQNHENFNTRKYVSVARQNGGCYLQSTLLFGEQRSQLEDGVQPHVFWTNLLEGKQPQWKYLSGSSQRNRKQVHYSGQFPSVEQKEEAGRKHKKIDSTKVDSSYQQVELTPEKRNCVNKEHQVTGIQGALGSTIMEFDDRRILQNEQSGLFELLKPAIFSLSEILMLEDNGKRLAEQFLNYVVKHYRVTMELNTVLQALQISVCWIAAEMLKKKIDHTESLALAREKLGFSCLEHETNHVYSKMKKLTKLFLPMGIVTLESKNYSGTATGSIARGSKENHVESQLGHLNDVAVELESSFGMYHLNRQGLSSVLKTGREKGFSEHVKKVQKKCEKQLERLRDKHKEELEASEKSWEERRIKLEKRYRLESAAIRVAHGSSSVGIDRLKVLDNDYAKRREDLESQISIFHKDLEARQQVERDEEQKKIAQYMERVRSLENVKVGEEPQAIKLVDTREISNGTMCINGNLPEERRESLRISDPERAIISAESHAPISYIEKDTQLFDVQVDRCTLLCSDSTELLIFPGGTCLNQQAADGSMRQWLEDEFRNDGAREVVWNVNETHSTSTPDEMSSVNCATCVPSDPSRNVETSDSECSFSVWVTHSGSDDQIRAPSGMQDKQLSRDHTSYLGTITPMHQEQNTGSTLVDAASRPFPELPAGYPVDVNRGRTQTYVPMGRGALFAHASHSNTVQLPSPTVSRVSPSYSTVLLQHELDSTHKAIDEIITTHEETKLQLKSECDKEIDEFVAHVRKKYDKKLDEAETSFSIKKNELEMYRDKVMMNKVLADAFRSKCVEYKAAGMQQGVLSTGTFSKQHPARPTSAACSYSSTQSAVESSCRIHPSVTLSTAARIPQINPVAPFVGQHQQIRGELRAPAPHLRPFRSASQPLSSSPTPSGNVVAVQPSKTNPPSSSEL